MIQAISLIGIKRVEEVLVLIMEYDDPAVSRFTRFELSYQLSPWLLHELKPVVSKRIPSVHVGCPHSSVFPNFASGDAKVLAESYEILDASIEIARSFGASILVLNPGYATNKLMPTGNLERRSFLNSEEFSPFIWKKDEAICNREYIDTPDYLSYFERMMVQLVKVAKKCEENGLKLAIKNLNPRVGCLCQTPRGMERLVALHSNIYFCLDVGHLWISSCLYGFNFLEGVKQLVRTGRVITSHLHSNRSCPDKIVDGKVVKGVFKDDHATFDLHKFPCDSVVAILRDADVNLVLATREDPLYNMKLLDRLVSSKYIAR